MDKVEINLEVNVKYIDLSATEVHTIVIPFPADVANLSWVTTGLPADWTFSNGQLTRSVVGPSDLVNTNQLLETLKLEIDKASFKSVDQETLTFDIQFNK